MSLHAIRISHAKANSNPPPKANPSIAAITGTGSELRSFVNCRIPSTNLGTSSNGIVFRSFRSAPVQNAPGTSLLRIRTLEDLSNFISSIELRSYKLIFISYSNI